jgi:hypothetical protein
MARETLAGIREQLNFQTQRAERAERELLQMRTLLEMVKELLGRA